MHAPTVGEHPRRKQQRTRGRRSFVRNYSQALPIYAQPQDLRKLAFFLQIAFFLQPTTRQEKIVGRSAADQHTGCLVARWDAGHGETAFLGAASLKHLPSFFLTGETPSVVLPAACSPAPLSHYSASPDGMAFAAAPMLLSRGSTRLASSVLSFRPQLRRLAAQRRCLSASVVKTGAAVELIYF